MLDAEKSRPVLSPLAARSAITMVIESLQDAHRHWPAMHAQLRGWEKGFAGSAWSHGGRSSDVSKPTEMQAMQPDRAREMLEDLTQRLLWMVETAGKIDGTRRDATAERRNPPLLCQNVYGCPQGNWADPGRKGRCNGCYQHLRKHDDDRESSRVRAA